jgi:hypothetical protein
MGTSRRNLQARLKIQKKIIGTPYIYQSIQIFFQKNYVSYLINGATHSYWSYPTKFAGSTQNPKKIIETRNLPIKTKIFSKKTMFRTLIKK